MWRWLDAQRGERDSRSVAADLLHAVASQEIEGSLSPELIGEMLKHPRLRRSMGDAFTAWPIIVFIANLVAKRKVESVLDPACGSGLLLHSVAESCSPSSLEGVEINSEMQESAEKLLDNRAHIHCGNFLRVADGLGESYDLIVSHPPLGCRLDSDQRDALPGLPRSRDLAEAIVYWSCSRLSGAGLAAFVLSARSDCDRNFQQNVNDLGCRISGLIRIPSGMLLGTHALGSVVLIERGEQGEVFVAKLSEDPNVQDQILKNLATPGRRGRRPALGDWCRLEDYRGFEAYENQLRLLKQVDNPHFQHVRGSDVFSRVTRVGDEESLENDFSEDDGDVLIGLNGKVFLGRDEAPRNIRNLIHVRINQDFVDPYYFRHWIRSEVGQLAIGSVSSGTAVAWVRPSFLMSMDLPLPPLHIQRQFAQALTRIDIVEAEIRELRSACWRGETSPETLLEKVGLINRESTEEEWINTLPYPLASILWLHKTTPGQAGKRKEILSHFFEALTAFVATIHLSAFVTDKDKWFEVQPKLLERLENVHMSLHRATFGTWKCVCETLGKTARQLLENSDSADLVLGMYCTRNQTFLREVLFSKKLVEIIGRANGLRNRHIGHSGAMSEKADAEVEERFKGLVNEVRSLFGSSWDNFELVLPGPGSFRNGEHHYRLPLLMGTNGQFIREDRSTTEPLEEGSLYLLGKGESSGLRILPLMRMASAPSTEPIACYFLNRVEKDEPVFVSYHYESGPELKDGFADTLAVLDQITKTPGVPGQEDTA